MPYVDQLCYIMFILQYTVNGVLGLCLTNVLSLVVEDNNLEDDEKSSRSKQKSEKDAMVWHQTYSDHVTPLSAQVLYSTNLNMNITKYYCSAICLFGLMILHLY